MDLQQLIINEIKTHLKECGINTTKLRTTKVHGVAGTTIYKILNYNYIPSNKTIKKLLNGFGYNYDFVFGSFRNVKKKENGK